jgi:hypothetical protein
VDHPAAAGEQHEVGVDDAAAELQLRVDRRPQEVAERDVREAGLEAVVAEELIERRVEIERQRCDGELGLDAEILGEEEAERAAGEPARRGEIAAVEPGVGVDDDLAVLLEVALLDAARLQLLAQLIADRLVEAGR